MTIATLLSALALVAYAALAVCVLARQPRTALNWTAALILAGLAIWSAEGIVHGIPTASAGLTRAFADIGSFGWGTFTSFMLVFTLMFTGRQRALRFWPAYILLVGLPALTIYAQFTGRIIAGHTLGTYGWTTIWSTSWLVYLFYAYYASFALTSLFLLWQFRRQTRHWRERRQATLMLSTGMAAMVLGALTDVVIRQFTRLDTPDLAGVLLVIWAAGLYLAVTRYGLMSLTPQTAADDILATIPDALLLLGPDGRFVRTNQAALDLFGYQARQLAGKHAELLFAEPAAFRTALDGIAGGTPASALEMDCRTQEGLVVPVSLSGRVMRDRGGDAVGIVLVIRDVTERKRAEEKLARAQAELVTREKLGTLARVAGSMAHELRNPLGAIRNATYYLQLTASDKLTGKASNHLDIINEEIVHASRIITGVVDFAHGRSSRPRPCRLSDIIFRAAIRAQLPRTVRIESQVPDDLPPVNVDPEQMEPVFLNIMANAHQAMPDGGRIGIVASRTNGVVRVAVSDSGCGIAPEHMARLFEPLFSTKVFGVGLGLAICKAFTEANKGTVDIETEVGKGTTVTVTLPLAEGKITSTKHQIPNNAQ
jgi:PAS domain S-box-containing protein